MSSHGLYNPLLFGATATYVPDSEDVAVTWGTAILAVERCGLHTPLPEGLTASFPFNPLSIESIERSRKNYVLKDGYSFAIRYRIYARLGLQNLLRNKSLLVRVG